MIISPSIIGRKFGSFGIMIFLSLLILIFSILNLVDDWNEPKETEQINENQTEYIDFRVEDWKMSMENKIEEMNGQINELIKKQDSFQSDLHLLLRQVLPSKSR